MNKKVIYDELIDFDEIALASYVTRDPEDEDSEDRVDIHLKGYDSEYSYYGDTAQAIWAQIALLWRNK